MSHHVTEKSGVIILAAGQSQRFGGQKLLEKINGKEMILHSIQAITQAGLHYKIFTQHPALEAFLHQQHIPFFHSIQAKQGMGATLAEAINSLSDWSSCLITLADKHYIQPSTYQQVHTHLTQSNIVVPTYQHQAGHPVGFQQHFFPQLNQLSGDQGAKKILQQHPSKVTYLPCLDQGILQDIDRPEDIVYDVSQTKYR